MFLDSYLEKWDWRNDDNPNLAAAALREVDRAAWRAYYEANVVFKLAFINGGMRKDSVPPVM